MLQQQTVIRQAQMLHGIRTQHLEEGEGGTFRVSGVSGL